MKKNNKDLYIEKKILSRYNTNVSGNFLMMENFHYGWISKYTLKEYYIKYIQALYED